MDVTFFRHGIAVDRADPLAPVDFERPLTLEGKNKTEAAGRGLRALGLHPSLILTSPFKRCVQTARLIAPLLGLTRKSILEREVLAPGADPRALWPEIADLGREAIIVVGHGGVIEPAAGVALGLPTPTVDTPDVPDLAFRTLHLKKAAALHLEVEFASGTRERGEAGASFETDMHARLAWLVSSRILRQLGRL
jgi:phosphohistidine phosphatase